MAQKPHIVDLNKSYIPGDPLAFPMNLHFTQQEDAPDQALPIMPYEGYNFLPTSYGYRSYFGTDSTLTLAALTSKCDDIITMQSVTYHNMLIALCADGIWTAKDGETVWTHAITLPDDYTTSGTYRQYTYTIIENELYIYRQGYSKVIKISSSFVVTEFTPSFLNMSGQTGIFRGNGRLCFWDSADSVSWSSALDLTDFTPSIENMVGNTKFLGVIGRIVNILPHGDGFVIYCTRSIVGVIYSTSGTEVWKASPVNGAGGIAHPKAVCQGQNDEEHFAYTSFGFVQIGHYNALSSKFDGKIILPEVYDFLKESGEPVYLQCHDARFLYISLINDDYINGRTSFTDVTIPSLKGPVIRIDTTKWGDLAGFPYISPKETYQLLDSFFVEPTGLVSPAVDRTAATHNESRWMATMRVPNLKLTANRKGFFSGLGASYKSYEIDLEPQPTATNTYPPVDLYCNKYSAGGVNGGGNASWNSWGSRLFSQLTANLDSIVPHIQTGTIKSNNTSIFTNLYSNEMPGLNTGGVSCMDLIYNFMSAVNEYRYILDKNERQIRTFLANLILDTHERTVYLDSWATPTFSASSVNSSSLYMPKAVGNVTIDMIQGDATNKASLAFSYVPTQFLKLNHISSDTTWKDRTTISIADTPYGNSSYIPYAGHNTTKTTFDHEPSVDEIVNYFSNVLHSITTPGLTAKFVLDYQYGNTPSKAVSSIAATTNGPICILKDITNNTYVESILYSSLIYGDPTGVMNTATWKYEIRPAYMTAEMTADCTTYPYLLNTSGPVNNSYGYQFCPAAMFMAFNNYALRPVSKGSFYPFVAQSGNPTFSFEAVPLTYEYSANNRKFFVKATIKNNLTSAIISNVVVAIFYIQTIDKITAVEEQIINVTEVNAINTTSIERDFLQLNFTETDRDVLVNNGADNWSAANLKNFFTPIWTDPGYGLPLVLTSLPTGAECKDVNLSLTYTREQCIPFSIFKNNTPTSNVIHGIDPTRINKGLYLENPMPIGPISYLPNNYVCYGYTGDWDGFVTLDLSDFTYPPATFSLQAGIPAPAYPTLSGSLVLDLGLKKWGKQASKMNALIRYSPINALDNGIMPYSNFGMESGILALDGTVRLFSVATTSGFLRYGKFGLYRLGFSEVFEVILHFRTPSTGKVVVDGSIDGKDIELNVQHTENFTSARSHVVKCHLNVRWYTVSIYGNFDLQYMEVRGIMAGRR